MRFEALKATCIKITVFWDIVPCSLVDINLRFLYLEDGDSKFLWNVGQYLYQAVRCIVTEDNYLLKTSAQKWKNLSQLLTKQKPCCFYPHAHAAAPPLSGN
jgi:hypothetical protein